MQRAKHSQLKKSGPLPAVIVAVAVVTLAASASAHHRPSPLPPATHVQVRLGSWRVPIHFEAVPSADSKRAFVARGGGYTALIAPAEALLMPPQRSARAHPQALRMKLAGAAPDAKLEPAQKLPARINYLIGNDPKNWRIDVPAYGRIVARGVWPGIDVVYHGNDRQLECDFIVGAGADPNTVRLSFDGADAARLDARGNLVLTSAGTKVRLLKPRVYQVVDGRVRVVHSGYLLLSGKGRGARHGGVGVGFRVAAYDRNEPLTIDPIVGFSTLLGGSGQDQGNAITLDSSGSKVYIAGSTGSTNFPGRNSCTTCSPSGGISNSVAFVAEFDPSAKGAQSLLYATYLGGSGNSTNSTGDSASGIAVDSSGNIYVTGVTNSSDFPTTPSGYLTSCPSSGECSTAFVSVVNPKAPGTAQLVYSTYFGGSTSEAATAIGVPVAGTIDFVGATSSSDFPITGNALQRTCNDCSASSSAGFVAELNTRFVGTSSLMYSTFLGGSTNDVATSILAPVAGQVAVAGFTFSSDFPTTPNVLQTACTACPKVSNAFVALISMHAPVLKQLLYSTFLGGSGNANQGTGDSATALAAQGQSLYVAGATTSTDFPTTRTAFQPACPSVDSPTGCSAGFVVRLVPACALAPVSNCAQLAYSTYLGGSGNKGGDASDFVSAMSVDSAGDAYVTGTAVSPDFPITPNAVQKSCAPKRSCQPQAFVTKLNTFVPGRTSLIYSSFLGGSGGDQGNSIAVDDAGDTWVTGTTHSSNFPTTKSSAFQNSYGGAGDAFVSGFNLAAAVTVQPTQLNFGNAVFLGSNIQIKASRVIVRNVSHGVPVTFASGALVRSTDFGSTACAPSLAPGEACTINVTFAPRVPGPRQATLTVSDDASGGQQSVTLVGVGVQGNAKITPAGGLSFSARKVGTKSSEHFVTLINNNPVRMAIHDVSIVGTNADSFIARRGACAFGVKRNSRCGVGIVFSPKGTGALTAALQFTDDAVGSPQQVPLRGTGK